MIKTGCQCFTCRHKDEPRLVAAYCAGLVQAYKEFIAWARRNNVVSGSIADEDIGGFLACTECDLEETLAYMAELPNIEEQ